MKSKPPPWSHLPNADRIDWVIADLKKQPKAWSAAGAAARDAAWSAAGAAAGAAAGDAAGAAAGAAAGDAAWYAARDAAWSAAGAAARDAAWSAARDAILALIAWDDSADLLDSDPDHVLTLALLGNPPAVLLLPAVKVLYQRKLENATSADLKTLVQMLEN